MQRGLFVILIGPGGVGKDTLLNRLVAEDPNFTPIVSYTTRAPRPGEVDGIAYRFVSLEEFARLAHVSPSLSWGGRSKVSPADLDAAIPNHSFGDFLEFVNFRGQYYGSSRVEVESLRDAGRDVVIVMDTHGGDMMVEMGLDPTTVFILPPSMEILRKRASSRGFEDPTVLEGRMAKAAHEIALADRYDYRIVNDNLENAIKQLHEIVAQARSLSAPALAASL